MAKVTQEDIDNAEVYGCTPEALAEAREQIELATGTYKFQLAGCKVEVVTKQNKITGAIRVNLQFKPKANDGSIAKRYGSVFERFVVPVANLNFKPEGTMLTIGLGYMRWLSEQTGVSQRDLVESFRKLMPPAGILLKDVVARYGTKPDETAPNGIRAFVKPAKATDKLTSLTADGGSSNGTSAVSMAALAAGSNNNEVSF